MATSYTRNTYVNGTEPALSAENLNKPEAFIEAVAAGGAGSVVLADDATKVADTTPSAVGLSMLSATDKAAQQALVAGTGLDADTVDSAHLSTDTALGTSDELIPSQKAVKSYVDTKVSTDLDPLLDFKSWDATRTYAVDEPAFYEGVPYKALQSALNKQPDTNPDYWEITGGGAGVASSPGFNFDNGQFDTKQLQGWETYADAAGTVPVDGTGGTADITLTLETADPLIGSGSGLLTKDAVNRQGQGISYDFSVDRGVLQNPCKITFEYETSADYADNDIGVYVYDKTNDVLLYPSVVNLPATGGNPASHVAVLLLNSTSTEYRLVFHVQSTSALAYTMKLDNVQVGNQSVAVGAAISEWREFPVSASGCTLGTIIFNRYRRVGSSLEWRFKAQITASTGQLFFNLPSALTISTPTGSEVSVLGYATHLNGSNGVVHDGLIAVNSINTSSVSIRKINGSAAWWGGVEPTAYSTNIYISFQASIPISQWTSNVNLASDFTEYASNSSATDANDTTSFVYGPGGSAGIIGVTNLTDVRRKRVKFTRPIQATDLITVELYDPTTGRWLASDLQQVGAVGALVCNHYSFVTHPGGMVIDPISDTELEVVFQQTPYGTTSVPWNSGGCSGIKWRVRKVSNGNMAEQVDSRNFVGEIVTSGFEKTPSSQFPAIPLDVNTDLTLAQAPLLVGELRNVKAKIIGTTDFTVTVSGSNVTFPNNAAGIAAVQMLFNDAVVSKYINNGEIANFDNTADFSTAATQRCLNVNGTDYVITNAVPGTRVVTVTGSPTTGTQTAIIYTYRIAGSPTSARLLRMTGFVGVAAGDAGGEVVGGFRKMDRGQNHWHLFLGSSNLAIAGGAAGRAIDSAVTSTGVNNVQNPMSDGTNGTPRTGKTTDPRTMGVYYYMWAKVLYV